jgi:NitT/TauT family transport system substrate-binding protein
MIGLSRARWRVSSMLALGALLLMLSAGSASAAHKDAGGGSTKALLEVNFAGVAPAIQPGIMQFWLPNYLGYFAQAGLKVNYLTTAGASDTLQRVLTKSVDFSSMTWDALLAARQQGIDLPLVTFYQYAPLTPYQVAVLPDSPLTSLRQLKGKKIGIISNAENGYFYARAAVAISGVDPSQVQFVSLGQGAALGNALNTHQVDAIATARQVYVNLVNAGAMPGFKLLPHPNKLMKNSGNGMFIALKSTMASRAGYKMLKGFALAEAKATIFAMANPDVACRMFFELYPQNLSPSKSYLVNIGDCKRTWAVSAEVDNPKNANLKRWGVVVAEQQRIYAKLMGYGKTSVKDLISNRIVNEIAPLIHEATIRKQAKNWCKVPSHATLCNKS